MARTITVEGMSCSGCEETVESVLGEVDGVTSVSADSDANTVTVDEDADVDAVVSAIENAGYSASA
ncbi:heavy-metal-associated domain-containing protein [Natrononativus amylolyticus]|uniref:heavy-metal-associated domain-containing protein n=1 Tax=Natrononativus amylolyticus TaxID=2963434 RepID=UPI0020CE9755|nr:cation transporter [Natrononativus amylolyticus]